MTTEYLPGFESFAPMITSRGATSPEVVLERLARGLDREGVPPACEVVLGDSRLDRGAEGAARNPPPWRAA